MKTPPSMFENQDSILSACPYGTVGGRLWVRETWFCATGEPGRVLCHYRADMDQPEFRGLWKPSIYMPRWASRITLEITDVRVERLQDISEEDARSEGAAMYAYDEIIGHQWYPVFGKVSCGSSIAANAKECFEIAWQVINGQGSWEANPWVWVVSFRRVQE